VGPYRVTVPARRTLHLRFNNPADPETVPRETDYASCSIPTSRLRCNTRGWIRGARRWRC
jgi:hypothetical protein